MSGRFALLLVMLVVMWACGFVSGAAYWQMRQDEKRKLRMVASKGERVESQMVAVGGNKQISWSGRSPRRVS